MHIRIFLTLKHYHNVSKRIEMESAKPTIYTPEVVEVKDPKKDPAKACGTCGRFTVRLFYHSTKLGGFGTKF